MWQTWLFLRDIGKNHYLCTSNKETTARPMLKKNILLLILPLFAICAQAQDEQKADSAIVDNEAILDSILADTPGVVGDSALCDSLPPLLSDSVREAMAAQVAEWKADVRQKLARRLDDSLFETAQLGFMVWDLTDDEELFSAGKRQRLRPASTMKNVTAIAVLDQLGPDYQFSTKLYRTGGLRDSSHTLAGSLYLVGGMDPYLKQEDFLAMADSLRAQGVDTISGGIYCDYSFKDKRRLGAGWCWDDGDDNPFLSPLTYQTKETAGTQLRQALRSRGIVVRDGSYSGNLPAGATLVCTRSRALTAVMRPMMKHSNNKCAESVFYQLAHHEGGRWASAKSGAQAVARTLRRAGLNPDKYEVADGSGLSLYNYVSAEMEVKLLRYAFQKKEIFATLYPLLPVAGVDGTLRKRMKGTSAQGNVHAKTGTVTGIRSLAGYCTAKNGHVLAFAIIVQGVDDGGPARAWHDKVCKILCD